MLRAIIQVSPLAIVTLDTKDQITTWNPAAERVFGWREAEVLGQRPPFVPDDQHADFLAIRERERAGEHLNGVELRRQRKDGTPITVRLWTAPRRDIAGRITDVVGIFEDVTDRRRAEAALRESEAQRDVVLQNVQVVLYRAQASGVFAGLWVSANVERVTGFPAARFTAEPSFWTSRLHPEDRETVFKVLRGLQEDTSVTYQYRWQCADGTYRWFLDQAHLRPGTGENPPEFLGTWLDITERKQLEAEAAARQLRLAMALEAAGMVTWEWDIPTRSLRYSEELRNVVRGTAVAPYCSLDTLLPEIHRDDRARLTTALEQTMTEGQSFECEYRARMLDGSYRWILGKGKPVVVERGTPIRVLGVSMDITARKAAEEQQRQLDLRLQHAQKEESLSVLAGGIAHDFNNLLTAILANIDLVSLDVAEESRARHLLGHAEAAAHRAADLCQQLLAYVGKTPLAFGPVPLNRLVEETTHLLAASLARHAQVRWQLADRVPPVRADPSGLHQVIMNLLLNAAEASATQPGQITLTTGAAARTTEDLQSPWVSERLPGGDYVFLEVADTGCGMDASVLSRMFEPFFSTKFAGRGLGLPAVLGIVRSHHGTIHVESTPGRGSTFRVWLPVFAGTAPAAAPAAAPTPDWRGAGTILVVDDEHGVRVTAQATLERLGFETLGAADGRDAIDLYRANPDRIWCVLLDATMPGLDGDATLRELVRIRENVRVVLTSGYSKDDILARFHGRGLAGFLQKPYRLQDLSAVLQGLRDARERH